MTNRYFDHLALSNVSPQRVADAGMTVVDRLQLFKPHEQAAAAATVFLLLCEGMGVTPQDVMVVVKNILMRSREPDFSPEFRALKMYVNEELVK